MMTALLALLWLSGAEISPTRVDAATSSVATTLQEADVLRQSARHFPAIRESLARRRASLGKLTEAQGAFDVDISGHGFSRLSGFYNGSVVESRVTQPLRPLGASVYGGYRVSQGRFPIYEDQYFTSNAGEAKLGVSLSLLRDRDIDGRRFGETDARLAVRQSDWDVLFTQLDVQRRALIAYWTWVAAGHQRGVYDDLLKLALDREQGLETQVERGARARIFLVENAQNITRRRILATQADRRLTQAANDLSFYWRDADGLPVVPALDQIPPRSEFRDFGALVSTGETVVAEVLSRRPELADRRAELDRALKRIALERNNLKPRLDVSLELANDFGSIAEGGISRDQMDTILGLKFTVPVQMRAARGKLVQAEAEAAELSFALQREAQLIDIEVKNILLDLSVAQEVVRLAETEVDQAVELMDAERRRFESGASDFFLVNVRERSAADARVKLYSATLDTRIARANYDAATVDLERLGLADSANRPAPP